MGLQKFEAEWLDGCTRLSGYIAAYAADASPHSHKFWRLALTLCKQSHRRKTTHDFVKVLFVPLNTKDCIHWDVTIDLQFFEGMDWNAYYFALAAQIPGAPPGAPPPLPPPPPPPAPFGFPPPLPPAPPLPPLFPWERQRRTLAIEVNELILDMLPPREQFLVYLNMG